MVFDFEYATTRVKGMKSKLLSETKLRELLEVKSISEMIELLEETEYKDDFVLQSAKYKGMELVMRALHENFKRRLQKLTKINPEAGRAALKLLLQEYEIQNINTLFAVKTTGLEVSDTDLIVIDKESDRLISKLKAAKSVPDLLKVLSHTEYSKAIRRVEKEYEKIQDFRVITRAINAYYYEKLQKLPHEDDDLLFKLINERNAVKNLMILLRVKKANPSADAKEYFIRKDRFTYELNKLNDYDKILESVGQKMPALAQSIGECQKSNSLVPLEIAMEKEFVKKVLRWLKLAVLDFAVVLGYLYLKELEVAAIRKIAYAKHYGFTDDLKKMIYSFNA
jgi:vacuolar-type H+-ATPase subunit C/Vma6